MGTAQLRLFQLDSAHAIRTLGGVVREVQHLLFIVPDDFKWQRLLAFVFFLPHIRIRTLIHRRLDVSLRSLYSHLVLS